MKWTAGISQGCSADTFARESTHERETASSGTEIEIALLAVEAKKAPSQYSIILMSLDMEIPSAMPELIQHSTALPLAQSLASLWVSSCSKRKASTFRLNDCDEDKTEYTQWSLVAFYVFYYTLVILPIAKHASCDG